MYPDESSGKRFVRKGSLLWNRRPDRTVATGLAPNTGTPLPFVSYGLTSLVSLYIGMGLVLNVGLQSSTYNKEIIQKEIDRREDYL